MKRERWMALQSSHYGNLAVRMNREREQKKLIPAKKGQARKTEVKYSIPVEEKLLYLLSVIVIVCITGFILSRYALISQYNYQIETLKVNTKQVQEQNSSLKLKVDELSKRERILGIAEQKLGMTNKNTTVRVLSR